MDIRFTSQFPRSRLDEIVDTIIRPRLWVPQPTLAYPDIEDWAQKVHAELLKEIKMAIIGLGAFNEIVGLVIFQHHKEIRDALEIKHLNVAPNMRQRYVASFLLRNAEVEGMRFFSQVTKVICDAKKDNFPVYKFLVKHHYIVVQKTQLYKYGEEDMVFEKLLNLS